MLSMYPACFIKESNGYSVIFPDLNYLSTCGETFEEAMKMAVDCLAGCLYTAKMDNEEVNKPSFIADIDAKKVAEDLEVDFSEAFVNMVTVDVAEYAKLHFEKSVKKTLTIPMWLNEAAVEHNINFSQTLQEALKEKLAAV